MSKKTAVLTLTLAALLALASCSPAVTETATSAPAPVAAETSAPAPSPSPSPSLTPAPTATASPTPSPTPEPTATPVTHDGGPDTVGIYEVSKRSDRKLLTTLDHPWVRGRDIAWLSTYASQEPELKGRYTSLFNNCWNKNPNGDAYKIGYCVSYNLKSGETFKLWIQSPGDAPKDPKKYFYQFIEIYLYDDLHSGVHYSHLLESQVKKNTLMTSIKLTAGKKIEEVESAKLMAFIFKDDTDFDPTTGEYIGPVSYEIPVTRGN